MVVTETGGMPEIIKDGINGFIIPVKDFESLASRIIELLSNGKLRERLGHTGRQMVEQQYTKEIIAENTLKLYKKFC
jgi:glycosyltransferase involved in cell wall biosynthesis